MTSLIENNFCYYLEIEKCYICTICFMKNIIPELHSGQYHGKMIREIENESKRSRERFCKIILDNFKECYENIFTKKKMDDSGFNDSSQNSQQSIFDEISQKLEYQICVCLCKNNMPISHFNIFGFVFIELYHILSEYHLPERTLILQIIRGIINRSNTTISSRIKSIGESLKRNMFERLNQSEAFAIETDETTDNTSKSKSVVFANVLTRKESRKEITYEFVGMYTNYRNETDAYSLIYNLLNSVDDGFINYCPKMIAITSDCGTNMLRLKKIFQRFQLKNKHFLLSLDCFLHQQNTVSSSIDDLCCMEAVDIILKYMLSSEKRIISFSKLIEGKFPFDRLSKYSKIRWLSSSTSVDKIDLSYDYIMEFLDYEIEEYFNGVRLTEEDIKKLNPKVFNLIKIFEVDVDKINKEYLKSLDSDVEDIADSDSKTREQQEKEKKEESKKRKKKAAGDKKKHKKYPAIIYLMKTEKFRRQLTFFRDHLHFHKVSCLSNQKHNMKVKDSLNELKKYENGLKLIKKHLEWKNFECNYFQNFSKIVPNPEIIPEKEKDQYVKVLEKTINKCSNQFEQLRMFGKIEEMITDGFCDEQKLNEIVNWLVVDYQLESEKKQQKQQKEKKEDIEVEKKLEIAMTGKSIKSQQPMIPSIPTTDSKVSIDSLPPLTIPSDTQDKKQIVRKSVENIFDSPTTATSTEESKRRLKSFDEMKECIMNGDCFGKDGLKPLTVVGDSDEEIEWDRKIIKQYIEGELELLRKGKSTDNWHYIEENQKHFPVLYQLVLAYHLVSPTTVKSECSFSDLNTVKNDLRNRLGDDTLESILRIKYCDDDEEIKDVVNKLVGGNK